MSVLKSVITLGKAEGEATIKSVKLLPIVGRLAAMPLKYIPLPE